MHRRQLLRSIVCGGAATIAGCGTRQEPPVSVESVQTTITGEAGTTVLTVVTLQLDEGADGYTTPVEMKIEQNGERVAYSWVKEDITTSLAEFVTSFPVVEVDGSVPIQPDQYEAFGRIEGGEWREAEQVDSVY